MFIDSLVVAWSCTVPCFLYKQWSSVIFGCTRNIGHLDILLACCIYFVVVLCALRLGISAKHLRYTALCSRSRVDIQACPADTPCMDKLDIHCYNVDKLDIRYNFDKLDTRYNLDIHYNLDKLDICYNLDKLDIRYNLLTVS